jgi:Ser/Thr protein kinase RdoA (MazF antagonist)
VRYRYPEGVPLARYFQDFGAAPGEMHRLSRSFMPSDESRRRPDWIGIIEAGIRDYLPPGLEITRKAFESLIEEAKRLTRDEADYCRTHGDFGDGNFAIDYDSGEVLEADEELDDGDS